MNILDLTEMATDRAALPGQSSAESDAVATRDAWTSLSRKFASAPALQSATSAMTQQAVWLAAPADRSMYSMPLAYSPVRSINHHHAARARKQRLLRRLQLQVAILSIAAATTSAARNTEN